jgi:hypothetical protein
MPDINYLAVVAAALSSFVLGGLWYSNALFGKAWQRAAGVTDAQMKNSNMPLIFGGSFALALIQAFVFAMFLGPDPALPFAVGAGLAAGLCWVAAAFGVTYLFERRSLAHFLINGGYNAAAFTLFGVILGLWR